MFKVIVFWEDWFSNKYPFSRLCDWKIEEPTMFLLNLLDKYGIKATFYCLGTTMENYRKLYQEIVLRGHEIGSHGYEHIANFRYDFTEKYISPNAWLGFTGGFWFRILPISWLKFFIKKAGFFYIHPYDIDENHPKLNDWWFNFKRQIGLKTARKKLEQVLEYCADKPA